MKTSRCAIYTRKSSEEGLDQSFNSLHAQREACEAYITSQKHEGWHALSAKYDDGGFSGGNMANRYSETGQTKWRKRRDSNPRYPFRYASFQDWSHQPLGHSSSLKFSMRRA